MTKIREFTLPVEAREQFSHFVKRFPFDPYRHPALLMKVMENELKAIIPKELTETLQLMGETGSPGIILIHNFPVDAEIPIAETVDDRSKLKGKASENAILGTVSMMGYKLHSSPKEQNGRIIHNISPVKGFEATKSSKGRDPFYLHTENPFEQKPPEFLILTALEGDKSAKTTYFILDDFVAALPKWVIEAMKKPEFEIRSGEGLDEVEKGVFSLITRESETGRLRLRLYQSNARIKALTPEAAKVLAFIEEAFKSVERSGKIQGIGLEPGDALIFNNGWGIDKVHGVMHGRGGYIQNPNRWLQRGFLHRQPEAYSEDLAKGYARAVKYALRSRDFTFKESAAVLRKAMLASDGCVEYKKQHPNATEAQILLYGTNPKKGTGSWIEAITREAVQRDKQQETQQIKQGRAKL